MDSKYSLIRDKFTSWSSTTLRNITVPLKLRIHLLSVHNKFVFWTTIVWGVIEIIICAMVLMTAKKYESSNFLNGLCKASECKDFIITALYFRIFAAVLLLIGNCMRLSFLMVPWFLNNAIGLFPLLPIIVSSYMDYKTASNYYKDGSFTFKLLSEAWNPIKSMFNSDT